MDKIQKDKISSDIKFKLINGGDHVFAKELKKKGWTKELSCGSTVFFHNKKGDVIGYAVYDNRECTSKKFILMED